MKMRAKFRRALGVLLLFMMLVVGVSWVVPFGARPIPWLFARAPETIKIDSNITAYFNDAGAPSSGNHWCWIVKNKFLTRYVVAEGYQSAGVMMGGRQSRPVITTADLAVRISGISSTVNGDFGRLSSAENVLWKPKMIRFNIIMFAIVFILFALSE